MLVWIFYMSFYGFVLLQEFESMKNNLDKFMFYQYMVLIVNFYLDLYWYKLDCEL